ncbi:MAG: metallophosphoesterase [Pirellula sp.]|nr:metallophosphoesterase [Pirellula sp.]
MISDTHGKHEELGTLSGDVLIHCGDFCHGFQNDGAHLAAIDRWFLEQNFERIFCVGGNHDFAAQERHANGIPIFENAHKELDRPKKVAGIFQMPSAESSATSEVSKGSGHGTWNVPATLESDE